MLVIIASRFRKNKPSYSLQDIKGFEKERNLEINGWTKLDKDGAQKLYRDLLFLPSRFLKSRASPFALNESVENQRNPLSHCLVGVEDAIS